MQSLYDGSALDISRKMKHQDLLSVLEQALRPYFDDFVSNPQAKIILALSGGMDSRVLLDLLAQLKLSVQLEQKIALNISAVHVHHGLSVHADSWAELCKCWCRQAEISYQLERVTLDLTRGDSIEQQARQARYAALAQHVNPGDIVVTAQHADDQLETFLLALKRGSGPKGLASMGVTMAFAQGQLIRPFLSVTRQDIEQYARDKKLEWVTDESNQDTRFDRNYIRHHVTPVLYQRWPAFHQAVYRSAQLCAQQEQLLEELLRDKLLAARHVDGSLMVKSLLSMSDSARFQIIRMWLADQQIRMPSQIQLDILWNQVALAKQDANPVLALSDIEIRRFEQRLFCVAKTENIVDWNADLLLDIPLILPDNLGELCLSSSIVGDNPKTFNNQTSLINKNILTEKLSISFNPEGRQACPIGKHGQKTLKKWYQQYSVASWQRRRMPILLCGSKVVAVAGLFVDRQFAATTEDGGCKLMWIKSN